MNVIQRLNTRRKLVITRPGPQGPSGGEVGAGTSGWSPTFSVITDGERRVLQVTDWIGGGGVKPAVGGFIGAAGIVETAAEAVDIRGAQGVQGPAGEVGAATWDSITGKPTAFVPDIVDAIRVRNQTTQTVMFLRITGADDDPILTPTTS